MNWGCCGGGGGTTIIYNHNTYINNHIWNNSNYNGYHPWAGGAAGSQNHAWYGSNGTFHPDGNYRPGEDTHYGPNGGYHPNGYFGPDGGFHPDKRDRARNTPNGGANGNHGLIGGNGGVQHREHTHEQRRPDDRSKPQRRQPLHGRRSRTAPASAETAQTTARKAIAAATAWPDVAPNSAWPGCTHRRNIALSAAADAVVNRPEKCGPSIKETGRSELSKEIEKWNRTRRKRRRSGSRSSVAVLALAALVLVTAATRRQENSAQAWDTQITFQSPAEAGAALAQAAKSGDEGALAKVLGVDTKVLLTRETKKQTKRP